jgi:hypothetical protein
MKLEERLTVKELLAKKPDYSYVPVYKPTGVYYNEKPIYEASK